MGLESHPGGSPLVSVVIATYNRDRFLPETVESVLDQRFRDFELIVVDDGSTDDTQRVLKSYGDRIRSFYQENRGPSAARNLGIRHARGRWVSIQDSDDLCTPEHLDALTGFVDRNPDCGMVFANGGYLGGPEHNRETIIPREKSRRLAQRGVRLVDLFEKSIVRLQAALMSKECLESIGGLDENLRICMDLDLSFRLFMRYPVAYLDKVVFLYRKHGGNIGRNQELRLLENIQVIEKLIREFPQSKEILGWGRIARRIAYRYYRLAKGRWKMGDRGGAREAIRSATSLCPFSLKYRLYQLRWI
ncbi:MAG: glycosyltransferase [Deltaproteobacteria bacterium]|nr:glycosyltransferase [Deltaproteobacteria bacterium]